jgi:hypothetical protein
MPMSEMTCPAVILQIDYCVVTTSLMCMAYRLIGQMSPHVVSTKRTHAHIYVINCAFSTAQFNIRV